jgi:hypothetical protein
MVRGSVVYKHESILFFLIKDNTLLLATKQMNMDDTNYE